MIIIRKNKLASNLKIIDNLDVGLSLTGKQVSLIKQNKFDFSNSYILLGKIPIIKDIVLERKTNILILITKSQIRQLKNKIKRYKLMILPNYLFFKYNLIKMNIILVKVTRLKKRSKNKFYSEIDDFTLF